MVGMIKSLFNWLNLKDKAGVLNALLVAYISAKYGPLAGSTAKDVLPKVEQLVIDQVKKSK